MQKINLIIRISLIIYLIGVINCWMCFINNKKSIAICIISFVIITILIIFITIEILKKLKNLNNYNCYENTNKMWSI